jgi:hypothetical protein
MKKVTVTINKDKNDPCKCARSAFQAELGDTLAFVFPGEQKATITFDNGKSPLDNTTLQLTSSAGGQPSSAEGVVKNRGQFTYTVTWANNCTGNGSGSVPPGSR